MFHDLYTIYQADVIFVALGAYALVVFIVGFSVIYGMLQVEFYIFEKLHLQVCLVGDDRVASAVALSIQLDAVFKPVVELFR